jgi:hypothetical protein
LFDVETRNFVPIQRHDDYLLLFLLYQGEILALEVEAIIDPRKSGSP